VFCATNHLFLIDLSGIASGSDLSGFGSGSDPSLLGSGSNLSGFCSGSDPHGLGLVKKNDEIGLRQDSSDFQSFSNEEGTGFGTFSISTTEVNKNA
jgi:hypothetical protein